jgi:hypothetical protein
MGLVLSHEVSCLKERNPIDTHDVAQIISSFYKDQLRPLQLLCFDIYINFIPLMFFTYKLKT